MSYSKQTWVDYPSETTPVNASRLNHMEDGIFNNSEAISEIVVPTKTSDLVNDSGFIDSTGLSAYRTASDQDTIDDALEDYIEAVNDDLIGIVGGDEYDATIAYHVGDHCIFENEIRRCKANTTAGISPADDTSHTYWDEDPVSISSLKNSFANKTEWKLHATVTGTTAITLPETFNEIYLHAYPNEPGTHVFPILIPYSALTDSEVLYGSGLSTTVSGFYSHYKVTKTTVTLNGYYNNAVNLTNTCTVKVFYR